MNYFLLLAVFFCTSSFGASKNSCTFEGGSTEISYNGDEASVQINYAHHGPTYHNCKVTSDEFGKLIDCNTGNRDFMILISKDGPSRSGGVMSKTLNLFTDVKC